VGGSRSPSGLPTLNGIEAARRIRRLSSESKILFVSQESSADVVQEALNLGAWGGRGAGGGVEFRSFVGHDEDLFVAQKIEVRVTAWANIDNSGKVCGKIVGATNASC
jgi:hypothetical protein